MNGLALSMAVYAVRKVQMTDFKTICWMFIFMFLYDIFGVFATGTITNIAQNMPLNLPIKITMPYLLNP